MCISAYDYLMAKSLTSNSSVAFFGMSGGAPREP